MLLGGKIVEERLIRERTAVTIGQSMKNTFSIPIEGLPLEFTLFAIDEDKYSLRFLGKMDGRVSDGGGQVSTLDALKSRGAQNQGEYWQVPLSESARGKLSMGDLTILFQFVTEPPRQPKPMLPASVRGTFADRFDPRLTRDPRRVDHHHFAIVIIALVMGRRSRRRQPRRSRVQPDVQAGHLSGRRRAAQAGRDRHGRGQRGGREGCRADEDAGQDAVEGACRQRWRPQRQGQRRDAGRAGRARSPTCSPARASRARAKAT